MSKAKTNALDALRALIAERQQYEQWMSALEAKKEGTPEHVYERVQHDYRTRFDRVASEIKGHAEELQLSISTLSSRLVEVARDQDTRREGLQEAELRAAVGEYEPGQWDQIRTDAEAALEKIAADREALDSQLSELRAIQKLSEMGPGGSVETQAPPPAISTQPAEIAVAPLAPAREPETKAPEVPVTPQAVPTAESMTPQSGGHRAGTAAAYRPPPEQQEPAPQPIAAPDNAALEPVAAAASAAANAAMRPRSMKSPTGGVSAVKARSEAARPDAAKTLKCPECGTANYPTEWYCERCGGELATM